MNSFIDLVKEEERKYRVDPDRNENTDLLFFLYVIKDAMSSYVVFDDINTNNITSLFTIRPDYSIWYLDCEPDGKLETIINRTPFEIPLIANAEFTIFLFSFLEEVTRRISPSKLAQPPTNGNLDFPITYKYFRRIIVGMTPGEWNYIDNMGRVRNVIKGHKIQELTAEQLTRPTDGYYKDTTIHFQNGKSIKGKQYVSKREAIEFHEKAIARAKIDIQRQKRMYANELEGMQAQGYPYSDSYDEYIRFIKTNLKDMKFGKFTIRVSDLFDLFIPSPLK